MSQIVRHSTAAPASSHRENAGKTAVVTFERYAKDGERYTPYQYGDGLYRVANPALGGVKHHATNQIAIRPDEIGEYLGRGFLLRMRGERRGQVNLIAASEIREVEKKLY